MIRQAEVRPYSAIDIPEGASINSANSPFDAQSESLSNIHSGAYWLDFYTILYYSHPENWPKETADLIERCRNWAHRVQSGVRSSGMIKGIIVFLLLATVAVTIFASEDGVDAANICKDPSLQINSGIIPPVVIEKYEYYEIRGGSEKELRSQMRQNGCKWNDGRKYDSLTSWHWKWDYGYDLTAQGCRAHSVRATIEVIFRYPKWMRTDDAPQPLVDKWDGYMKNLIMHENGHRDMAINAAAELSCIIAALPPASSCAELDRKVRALRRRRMEKLNVDEMGYDETTNHGCTQGAVFP
jgi:predicted secreted Zn-dependent protease